MAETSLHRRRLRFSIRCGTPAYRLSVGAFRRYNWEYRPSHSLSWLLTP